MESSAFEELKVEDQLSQICNAHESKDTQNLNNYFKWFVQFHHPKGKNSNVQNELKKFIFGNDLFDLLREIKSEDVPNEYVDMLWMIARIDDESIESEISKRFLDVLQQLISTNLQNETLIESACIVIGLISTNNNRNDDDDSRNLLVNSGIIDYLGSCLKIYAKNSVIVQRACKALTNACYHNIQTKLCFIENSGFSVLLALLKSDLDLPAKRCCAQLLRTIVHLSESHHSLLLNTENPIQNIVTAMKENENDATTVWHFLWTVLNLSINQRNAKKEFGKRGVCQVVIGVMKIYKTENYIQQTAITTLRQLATIVSNRMILAREQFPAVLVDLMEQPTAPPSLIVTILETLRRLCLTGLNRKLLATPALLGKFREVAKLHIENVAIANVALNVLANLAHGANATRVGLKTNGIIDFLNTVMVKHHLNAELVHDAYEIAHIIPREGDVEEETSSESQSDSDEDYSGDDDVSKYISEWKESGDSSNLESLKATQKHQEEEILLLKKQIEEKEDCQKRYTKKINELTKDLQSQYDSSRETIQIQNSNAEISQDLDEKLKRTQGLGQLIDNSQDLFEESTNKYLLLGNEEEETHKKNEESVNSLKQKIEEKKKNIKGQQEEILRLEDAQKKVGEAEQLFQETKSHLLVWIQLAIKLEGIASGHDDNFDKDTLQNKIRQNFLAGLGLDDDELVQTTTTSTTSS
jgi:hypothetical protein